MFVIVVEMFVSDEPDTNETYYGPFTSTLHAESWWEAQRLKDSDNYVGHNIVGLEAV